MTSLAELTDTIHTSIPPTHLSTQSHTSYLTRCMSASEIQPISGWTQQYPSILSNQVHISGRRYIHPSTQSTLLNIYLYRRRAYIHDLQLNTYVHVTMQSPTSMPENTA